MAVGGVGGLIGQLFNPGLDDELATHFDAKPQSAVPARPGSAAGYCGQPWQCKPAGALSRLEYGPCCEHPARPGQ